MALCRAIVPAAFAGEGQAGDGSLPQAVERRLGASDPAVRRRVALALTIVGHRGAGLVMTGRPRAFAALGHGGWDLVLGRYRDSAIPAARTIYQGLRRLVLSTYYGEPAALRGIGWLGPLHERRPALDWEGPLLGAERETEPVRRVPDESRRMSALPPVVRAPPREGTVPAGALASGSVVRAAVCVVGSGAGGAVVAARLAERGYDVVVVEEGSWWSPADFTEREAEMMPALYAGGGLQATADLSTIVLQGRAVGGSALVNWLVMLRTPDWVLDEWVRDHGAEGLSAAELAPVFDRIEAETRTRVVPDDAHSPANRALLEGARALGWRARPAAINVEGCVRAGTCGLGCRYDAKRGPATVYLPRALAAGARVITECRVDRIEVVSRGAAALKRLHCSTLDRTSGDVSGCLTIETPVMVLAAGAVGTPAILQRSALGGTAVGRYLRLHPTTAVVGAYDRVMYAAAGIPISAICDEFHRGEDGYGFWVECPPLYPAFAAAALPGWGGEHRLRMLGFERLSPLITLVRDGAERVRSSGDVRLDRGGRPVIRYALADTDRRALARGMRAAAEMHLAAGATEAFTLHERPHRVRTTAELSRLAEQDLRPNRFALYSAHVMGSCRLGTSARTSACTPDGAVRGVPGIYVADGSLLPTAPAVNPQETIMAVASVLAHRIADRHGAG